ncbi:hypothetical protein BDK51DRAFT_36812 [Blyttiomyces helicus]|uniref:Uncharacterized protein n=1 Tax=Blyttiomyces helicus TaxID=388810 RepID=A0A4V1IQC3_9FUNG|nr:hypothetical protein BDK51DRAFT_36812 [Blyttiomyces helicus]|eukprot:RKO86057.1 hypothetical protein BDK51DRAFT_36812 [Blyttiomyces helicus]
MACPSTTIRVSAACILSLRAPSLDDLPPFSPAPCPSLSPAPTPLQIWSPEAVALRDRVITLLDALPPANLTLEEYTAYKAALLEQLTCSWVRVPQSPRSLLPTASSSSPFVPTPSGAALWSSLPTATSLKPRVGLTPSPPSPPLPLHNAKNKLNRQIHNLLTRLPRQHMLKLPRHFLPLPPNHPSLPSSQQSEAASTTASLFISRTPSPTDGDKRIAAEKGTSNSPARAEGGWLSRSEPREAPWRGSGGSEPVPRSGHCDCTVSLAERGPGASALPTSRISNAASADPAPSSKALALLQSPRPPPKPSPSVSQGRAPQTQHQQALPFRAPLLQHDPAKRALSRLFCQPFINTRDVEQASVVDSSGAGSPSNQVRKMHYVEGGPYRFHSHPRISPSESQKSRVWIPIA